MACLVDCTPFKYRNFTDGGMLRFAPGRCCTMAMVAQRPTIVIFRRQQSCCQKPLASPCHKSTSLHVLFLYFRCPAMSHLHHHTQRHSRTTPKPLKGAYEVSCRFLRYSSASSAKNYTYDKAVQLTSPYSQANRGKPLSACLTDTSPGRLDDDTFTLTSKDKRVITANRSPPNRQYRRYFIES